MAEAAMAPKQSSFVSELEAKNLHPLWDRYQRITPIKPQPRDATSSRSCTARSAKSRSTTSSGAR
jgi:hypothetical protein